MYNEENIKSAVKAGVLTPETAEALRLHVAKSQTPLVDEEHFRLITGFNDIFVVIASLLLLSSINWIMGSTLPWLGSIVSAIAAWGLSEFFVRKRRMALPAIVLLLAFVTYVFTAGFTVMTHYFTGVISYYQAQSNPINYIVPAIFATVAAWLHWLRFKVPITIAAGTATVVVGLMALLLLNSGTKALLPPACMLVGISVFIFAMRWDSADINRQTRKSDVAFWLHLLAAPLIIHPVFQMLGVLSGKIYLLQALIVLMLYLLIATVSLLIDRRALMVSALGYVVYVFSSLINDIGSVSAGFGITSFVIGSALLMLSAYWHKCRSLVLGFIPDSFKKYLPQ